MLLWFSALPFAHFLAVLAAANLLMYLGSWSIVSAVQRMCGAQTLNSAAAKPTRREYALSFLIVLINISVGVPGWLLWKAHRIELLDNGVLYFLLDVFVLLFYFDFSMYVLHRLMHQGPLYRIFHSKHHDHVNVNGISLYVMNPAEAWGFGLLLIGFLMVHPTNLYALLFFLTLNWAYGTMGHSGVPIHSRVLRWLIGDTEFHHRHHSKKVGNFGFYTPVWDNLFGTRIQ